MSGGALAAHVVVARRSGFRLDAAVSAEPGEVVAVMGPSGAGKSTLLAAIAGLLRSAGDSVTLDGAQLAGRRPVPPSRRSMVLLGQDPMLFPHLTARENIAFGPRARGVEREQAGRDADEWLWRVGLAGLGAQRPAELSGGQQQRVALARALAIAPRLLLLDEPMTSLDTETAGDIRALVHDQLQHTPTTALVVTHDAVDAAALASRLVILEDGRITQEGLVRDVLAAPATRFSAAVAGLNRIPGTAKGGVWRGAGGGSEVVLAAADATSRAAASVDGVALAALVRPGDVRIERAEDTTWTGALRLARASEAEVGTWLARVIRLEQTPAGARVHTAEPAVAADVPAEAVAALGLAPGVVVRIRIEPARVRLTPVVDSARDPDKALSSRR
ncbi:MAG: ATP-binding cassette domain-containing protein [Microbacterium sp.]